MNLVKSSKEFLKIFIDYKFSIFFFIIYEILYFLKGYKGFKFAFSTNKSMTNSIPCPYYFLHLIKKNIDLKGIDLFVDYGSGYGRIINFFSKNFSFKRMLGIEYLTSPYNYCLKKFSQNLNVEFINDNFNNFDLKKYYDKNKSSGICLFFSAPFSKSEDLVNFINKISILNVSNVKIVIVNYKYNEIVKINNLKIMNKQYINENRGFCICSFY